MSNSEVCAQCGLPYVDEETIFTAPTGEKYHHDEETCINRLKAECEALTVANTEFRRQRDALASPPPKARRSNSEEVAFAHGKTLSVTHICDGEEVVTGGEDGQVWIATFASKFTADWFVGKAQYSPFLIAGERAPERATVEPDTTMIPKSVSGSSEPEPIHPHGHFWRGDTNRFICQHCLKHHDQHIHSDMASLCPRETGESHG